MKNFFGRSSLSSRRLAAPFFSLVLALAGGSAHAQGVTFVGTQSQVGNSSNWNGPVGVAADSHGNLYVASYLGHYISEVNLATGVATRVNEFTVRYPQDMKILGDTVYIASQGENLIKAYSLTTRTLVNSWSLQGVFAIAIDSNGNIYGGQDSGTTSAIWKFPAGSSTGTIVKSGVFQSMTGLAFDASGMLYASDTGAAKIYKLNPGNGYSMTTVPINVTQPRDLIFDPQGRLYVAEGGSPTVASGAVHRYPSGNYDDAHGTILAQNLFYEEEVAVASTGDVYVSSFKGNVITQISPHSNFQQTVPVGSSATQTLTFSVAAGTTIGSSNSGQADSGIATFNISNNTCTAGTHASAGLCTMDLTFAPAQPAFAHGWVDIEDSNGNPFTTVYSSGVGVAPQLAFTATPASQNLQLGSVYGIVPLPGGQAAVTTSSSLYVGNFGTTPSLVVSDLNSPREIAVDPRNNVFIADTGNNRVVTMPAFKGATTSTVFSTSTSSFTGVAVDGGGSVYYADSTNGQIIRRDWADNTYGTETVVATGLATLGAIAVDNAQNLFVLSGNSVLELTAQNGGYASPVTVASSLSTPTSIVLDGNDNIYISDNGNQRYVEIPNVGGSYGTQFTLFASANDLQQAFLQPTGLVYVMGGANGTIVYADRSTPPSLTFGQTTLNTTNSAGPLSFPVQNIGNAAVSFAPSANGNPSSSSTGFPLNTSATTCPTTTLTNGDSCVVAVDYKPQTVSDTNATLTFTDNVLNVTGSTQVASLSGSVVPPTPSVTGISSHTGYVTGGDTITITGTFFTGTTSVMFGSTQAHFTVVNDTTITVTVPPSSSVQVVDITVTTPNGTSTVSGDDQYSYTALTPTLAFAGIPAHTFGDAPFAVSATSASTGAVTYSVLSGPATVAGNVVTITGAGTVRLKANQAADGIYLDASTATSFVVNVAKPTVALAPASIIYGSDLSAVLKATATFGNTSVPGSFTFTATPAGGSASVVTASTVLNAGSYTLTATFTPTDAVNYSTTTANAALTVAAQTAKVAVTTSSSSVVPGQSVTFTVTDSGTGGNIPTGTVTIMDGNTVIATVTLTNGTATYTTAALLSGSHTITVSYSGDANHAPVQTTTTVAVAPLDFTMANTGTTYQTVIPGRSTTYSFALAPMYGTYPGAVSFAVSGLPAGASYTITPSTVAASGGQTTAVLTVQTANVSARNESGISARGMAPMALAVLLLPFASARRLRKAGKMGRLMALVLFTGAALVGMAGLTGCGSGNGFLGQAPKDYTVTVTATSGTVQHSANVTLNLQ